MPAGAEALACRAARHHDAGMIIKWRPLQHLPPGDLRKAVHRLLAIFAEAAELDRGTCPAVGPVPRRPGSALGARRQGSQRCSIGGQEFESLWLHSFSRARTPDINLCRVLLAAAIV